MTKHWIDKQEYPFTSKFHKINDHNLHYIDEGEGDVLLFVHGTPSWSFDFRNVIKELRLYYRCIALDHMGFGLSDKPDPYDYSTLNHSKTLEDFILKKELQNITMIVHDFGGTIGFHYAIRHPETIKDFVVINSWLWSNEADPDFIKLKRILRSPLLPFLYLYLNFSVCFILPRSFGEKKLSRKLLQQYVGPLRSKRDKLGTLAFAKSLLLDQEWFESLWVQRALITPKKVLFVWGMRDPVVKPSKLEKFMSGFPKSELVKLDSCGHFPQEEEPHAVASAIREFLLC